VVNAGAYSALTLDLLRDDGSVVFLNGTEVIRTNMPTTNIYYNTFALEYVDGNNEKTFQTYSISPQNLIEGENAIAVEIHQQSRTSSDISFNMQFTGRSEMMEGDTTVVGTDAQLNYLPLENAILRAVFEPLTGKEESDIPVGSFELAQNYPNPFNPQTTIVYAIGKSAPKSVFVELKIFDISGREITTIVSKNQTSGRYSVTFDASGLASGIYFYRLQAGDDFLQTRKLVLLR
jgi:hypothetical protein